MTTASTYSSSPFSPVINLPAAGIKPTRLNPSLSQMAREALLAFGFEFAKREDEGVDQQT
jgi:hypothetical protein